MPDIGQIIDQHLAPFGRSADLLTAQLVARAEHREELRGKKTIRLPLVTGVASGSALSIGGDRQPLQTPDQGFVWSVRHLVIEGMATGATPDIVNITRGGRIIWQLNGNQFAQTWGLGEVVLNAGETLAYVSVGTFTSTSTIIAHGMADNIPAQLIGEFF